MELQSTKSYTLMRIAAAFASFLLVLFIALDAMGAHAFNAVLEADISMLRLYSNGTKYLFFVAFSMFAIIGLHLLFPFSIRIPLFLMGLGTVLFPVLLLVLFFLKLNNLTTGVLGTLAPFGGLALMLAWLFVLIGILKNRKPS